MASNESALLGSEDDLHSIFHGAEKPREAWRIGAEAEKIGVFVSTVAPLHYSESDGKPSVSWLLDQLVARGGWQAEPESPGGPIIALRKNGASVTLEPGSQFELSGAPLETVHAIAAETRAHIEELNAICREVDLAFLGIGFHPFARQADLDWAPKARYSIMREFLPTRGAYGLDMMRRTATVQANFDYDSEQDAIKKLQASLRLSPLITAMFANSPFYEGAPFGGKSFRAKVWLDVEPSRQGLVPNVLRPDASYTDYIEWALDAPMFLLKRDGKVVANTGQPFRAFLRDGFEGHRATFYDWEMHLNTMFPEVRLKRTLEVRGADSLPEDLSAALPAIWTGLLYDSRALDEAAALTESFAHDELLTLRKSVPMLALQSPWRGGTLVQLAEKVIDIAKGGLERRAQLDGEGKDERRYLAPLEALISRGECAADRLLAAIGNHEPNSPALASAIIANARL